MTETTSDPEIDETREDRLQPPLVDYAPAFWGFLAARVSDRILEDGARVADAHNIVIPPRCLSTMLKLQSGPQGVSEMSRQLGVSHVAVMKNVRRLHALGMTETLSDPTDARRKPIALTEKGEQVAKEVLGFVDAVRRAYLEAFEEIGVDVYKAVLDLESALHERSFFDRLNTIYSQSSSAN